MGQSIFVRGHLVAGLLTLTACATAPATNPPPTLAAVQKESPVVKAAPAPAEQEQVAFGFSMGMTLTQANALAALRLLPRNSATFAARRIPVTHPPFSEVLVQISPTVGLCRVVARPRPRRRGRRHRCLTRCCVSWSSGMAPPRRMSGGTPPRAPCGRNLSAREARYGSTRRRTQGAPPQSWWTTCSPTTRPAATSGGRRGRGEAGPDAEERTGLMTPIG